MLIRDGVIVAVGSPLPPEQVVGVRVIDLGDLILSPGFVDAHCHLEWGLMDGLVPDAPFGDWFGSFVHRTLRVTPRVRERSARWAAMTALRNGTTTLADSGPSGFGVAAVGATGIRGVVHLEIFGRERGREAREKVKTHAEAVLAARDIAGHRVEVGVSPHAPYTVGPHLWYAVLENDVLGDAALATHIAESPDEVQLLDQQTGRLVDAIRSLERVPARWDGGGPGVVSRLAAAEVLREGLLAAHCVQVNREDALMLAQLGVRMVHCPTSNARLLSGDSPIELLTACGVTVGLGTDSPASAGAFDMAAEARAAYQAALRRGARPGAADMLAMATIGSARALGIDDDVGAITPGRRADLIATRAGHGVDVALDPVASVLDARSRVVVAWVDGEVVLDGGFPRRLDPEGIERDARVARDEMATPPTEQ